MATGTATIATVDSDKEASKGYLDALSRALRSCRKKPKDWVRRLKWSGEEQARDELLDDMIQDITIFGNVLKSEDPFYRSRRQEMKEYAKMQMRGEPWITVGELYTRLIGFCSGYAFCHNRAWEKDNEASIKAFFSKPK